MTPERRAVVSIVGAVSVLVVVTAIILIFGVIPLPDFVSLVGRPDPSIPGVVAYIDSIETPCVFTVPASGGDQHAVWCGRDYVDFVAWTEDGLLTVTDWSTGPAHLLIDPATGTEVDRVAVSEQFDPPERLPNPKSQERADGSILRTDRDRQGTASVVVFRDGTSQTILSVEGAPGDYRFNQAQWSPDGAWVLVSDSAGRILIVGADGSPTGRVLADGLDEWGPPTAWYIPGNPTYTVEIPR